jgi:hypothetical protein
MNFPVRCASATVAGGRLALTSAVILHFGHKLPPITAMTGETVQCLDWQDVELAPIFRLTFGNPRHIIQRSA